MASNTNIQLAELDFDNIKANFITYLKSQNILKDYDYSGSALSVLLDILAVNTQYNGFYLNMVANEMFLDSATQRASVVSHAKALNYIPKSVIAPTATVNVAVNGIVGSSLTLPKYTTFLSEPIDGVNYNFLSTNEITVNTSNNVALFQNVEIKEAVNGSVTYTVDSTTNPDSLIEIRDANVDTTTLQVIVQKSSSNTSYDIYSRADNFLTLDSTSLVYFVQENNNGFYEVYFGDNVLGKKLQDGNIVKVTYLSSQGTAAAGANSFTLMDTISGYSNFTVTPRTPASKGNDRESIESIKFQAPKSFSSQNRAVSKEDYITILQQNTLGISFDAVNVWGGEENIPPVYGQVFICLKPSGSYNLTSTQKERLINDVIKPVSVLTVSPTIVDPDYTYLKIDPTIYFNPSKTTSTANEIQSSAVLAIKAFAAKTLNTFNSTLNVYELLGAIQSVDQSIISSEFELQLQKKFMPNLTNSSTYTLFFNTPLKKGTFLSGVTSYPSMSFRDKSNFASTIRGIFLEEIPVESNGIDTIDIINPGFGYLSTPKVSIFGDGSGATAHAVIVDGRIKSIVVDNAGTGYTGAVVTISAADGDFSGKLGAAVANIQGSVGKLRTYYYNNGIKTIFDSNIGTIDYINGIVTLNNFNPLDIDNPLGQLTISVTPLSTNVSSTYNRIITLDNDDTNSIIAKVISRTN